MQAGENRKAEFVQADKMNEQSTYSAMTDEVADKASEQNIDLVQAGEVSINCSAQEADMCSFVSANEQNEIKLELADMKVQLRQMNETLKQVFGILETVCHCQKCIKLMYKALKQQSEPSTSNSSSIVASAIPLPRSCLSVSSTCTPKCLSFPSTASTPVGKPQTSTTPAQSIDKELNHSTQHQDNIPQEAEITTVPADNLTTDDLQPFGNQRFGIFISKKGLQDLKKNDPCLLVTKLIEWVFPSRDELEKYSTTGNGKNKKTGDKLQSLMETNEYKAMRSYMEDLFGAENLQWKLLHEKIDTKARQIRNNRISTWRGRKIDTD